MRPDAEDNNRDSDDYRRLEAIADRLNADVVALQEVDGEAAAAEVFDVSEYDFFFSSRNNTQLTGFAVRKTLDVVQNPDFEGLNVTGGLRHGTDITVTVEEQPIRFLSVHLKSGCFDRDLESASPNSDCGKLNRQIPELESWIDTRAEEMVPFVVFGDFNRRFDASGDTFWPEIDDGDPENADLLRVNEGETSSCWQGQYPMYIDHLVFDSLSSEWIVDDSFEQILYNEPFSSNSERARLQRELSDHCPLAVNLELKDGPEPEPRVGFEAEVLKSLEQIEELLEEIRERLN